MKARPTIAFFLFPVIVLLVKLRRLSRSYEELTERARMARKRVTLPTVPYKASRRKMALRNLVGEYYGGKHVWRWDSSKCA